MPTEYVSAVTGARNDDVERDLVWLQRKLRVATYQDVDDVRRAVIVLKRWARLRRASAGSKKFVAFVHHFVKSARIIQLAFRRYRFRRNRLLEGRMLRWTNTWRHMLEDEADRHRADTRRMLTDAYQRCLERYQARLIRTTSASPSPTTTALSPLLGTPAAAALQEQPSSTTIAPRNAIDPGEVATLFDGALKITAAPHFEVDPFCVMEATMCSYEEMSAQFRYRWRALRKNNPAYFASIQSIPQTLLHSAARKEGGGAASEGHQTYFDEHGRRLPSRAHLDAVVAHMNLFTEPGPDFTEMRARYDVSVFANAARDLGMSIGEQSSRATVRFLINVARHALGTYVRGSPVPPLPLAIITRSLFPETTQPPPRPAVAVGEGDEDDDDEAIQPKPLIRRLSSYSMQHFASTRLEGLFPPSDDDEGDGDAADEEGPFARTNSERRLATFRRRADRWAEVFEALPTAGPLRERTPWTVRLGAYSRLRAAKMAIGERLLATAAAAHRSPSRASISLGRRRSSVGGLDTVSPSAPLASSQRRRSSLGASSSFLSSGGASQRRASQVPKAGRTPPPPRTPPHRSTKADVVASSEEDEDGTDAELCRRFERPASAATPTSQQRRRSSANSVPGRRTSEEQPTPTKAVEGLATRRASATIQQQSGGAKSSATGNNDGMQHFLERHARIHQTKSLAERKEIGQRMNVLLAKKRPPDGSAASSSGGPQQSFRPRSPWGAPQLRYNDNLGGTQRRILPHSHAARIAHPGRLASPAATSHPGKSPNRRAHSHPRVSLSDLLNGEPREDATMPQGPPPVGNSSSIGTLHSSAREMGRARTDESPSRKDHPERNGHSRGPRAVAHTGIPNHLWGVNPVLPSSASHRPLSVAERARAITALVHTHKSGGGGEQLASPQLPRVHQQQGTAASPSGGTRRYTPSPASPQLDALVTQLGSLVNAQLPPSPPASRGVGLSRLRPVDVQHRKLGFGATSDGGGAQDTVVVAERVRESLGRRRSPPTRTPVIVDDIATGLTWHSLGSVPLTPDEVLPSALLMRSTRPAVQTTTPSHAL